MFHSKSKQAKKEIEGLFHEIQINLENNYKDLAIDARKRAQQRLEEVKHSGDLGDKDYEKLKKIMEDYTKRMEGYHH